MTKTIDIGLGQSIAYAEWGADNDGTPVVFFHGSGPGASGLSNFKGNGPALASAGHRALAFDLLGYGASSKPTDVQYSLATHMDAMVRAMDALDLATVHLVGNSMGGAAAILLALEHPGRVDKLLLMAPGGIEEREVYMEMRGIRSMLRCIYGPEGITLAGMQKVFEKQLFDPSQLDPAIVEARTAVALTQPIEVFKTMNVPCLAARLSELCTETLVLWGEDDLFCPASGADIISAALPDAAVLTFPKTGHWVMVERQTEFNELAVEFLAG